MKRLISVRASMNGLRGFALRINHNWAELAFADGSTYLLDGCRMFACKCDCGKLTTITAIRPPLLAFCWSCQKKLGKRETRLAYLGTEAFDTRASKLKDKKS